MVKISVIGAGSVGAAVCYSLLLRKLCAELILVDVDEKRVKGEVSDLCDGTFLSNTRVKAGTPQQAGQSDIIIITAGAKQKEGETRIQLIDRNLKILRSVIGGMQPLNSNAIIIIVANPCDILTYFAQRLSGLPSKQVFGSGTFLDTARLRNQIAEKLEVADTAVHAYVLGEHGDSQFVAWSSANIAGIPLISFPPFDDEKYRNSLSEKTKNKAYEIIQAKGATYFGVAAVVSSICECLVFDQKHIRPLSVYSDEFNVCLSFPSILGSGGVNRILDLNLNETERQQLLSSAKRMREIIDEYEPKLG